MTETIAAYKARSSPTQITNSNNGVSVFYDFIDAANPMSTQISGSGVISLASTYPDSIGLYYPGSCSGEVSALGDDAYIYSTEAFSLSQSAQTILQGRFVFDLDGERRINVAGKQQKFWFGLFSSSITGEIWIGYDPSISNNWLTYFKNSTTTDQTITTVAADDSDFYLKMVVTPSITYFYINNALVHSSINSVDSAFDPNVFIKARVNKVDNAATVGFVCDAIKLTQALSPIREFT